MMVFLWEITNEKIRQERIQDGFSLRYSLNT
jgi:hypothetical protein